MVRSGSPLVTGVTWPRGAKWKRPSPCVPSQMVPSPASPIAVTGERAGKETRGARVSSRPSLHRTGPLTIPASSMVPSRARVIAVIASSIVSSTRTFSKRPS